MRIEIKNQETIHAAARQFIEAMGDSHVFATGDAFFAYPNNYNYYVSYYKDTFQHGGISMEEMLVPIVTLSPK